MGWEQDIDLHGTMAAPQGRTGPHIYIRGTKADTPHWVPLHPAAVQVLRDLRREPVIDRCVFPIRGSRNPASRISHLFADLCIKAGLTEEVERDGQRVAKNRWSLHDCGARATPTLRNGGASPKERAALLGHRTTAVNESHYEAMLPGRERELIDGLPAFGMTA